MAHSFCHERIGADKGNSLMSRIARKWIVFIVALMCCVSGAGWNDYTRKITPNYKIARANFADVRLFRIHGNAEAVPHVDDTHVGPVVDYAVTKDHIFTHNVGRKFPAGRNPNDDLGKPAPSKDFFYVVERASGNVTGPLKQAKFQSHAAVKPHSPVNWQATENPNVLKPLLGALYFLAMVGLIFAPVWLPVIGVLCVVLLITLRARRRHKNAGVAKSE